LVAQAEIVDRVCSEIGRLEAEIAARVVEVSLEE
jgi:hypothetical protein